MEHLSLSHRRYRDYRRALLSGVLPTTCDYCGNPVDVTLDGRLPDGPTLDHITPRSEGGTHDVANLRVMHRRCNLKRGTKRLEDPHSRSW